MTITVLLVGDHHIVRDKLQTLLRRHPDLELISRPDAHAATRLLGRRKVDVIVLDSHLPAINGIKTADAMTSGADGPPVILLSLHTDARYVKASFGSGVAGYLLRESASEELPEAIRVVVEGNCYLSPPSAEAMPDGFVNDSCRLKEK